MNKAKKIREYQKAHPSATPQDVADACNVSRAYVYQVIYKLKHKNGKKTEVATTAPTHGQDVLREEIERLHAEIDNLRILDEVNEEIIEQNMSEIQQLNNDIVGYRAVISYLQGQLNGITV